MTRNDEPDAEFASVRYLVDDVETCAKFYTDLLGFEVVLSAPPALMHLRKGPLRFLLNGPQSSSGAPMANGDRPTPGGWNRIQVLVADVDEALVRLRAAGVRVRGQVVVGRGGTQVLVEDPAGNPVELFAEH